MGLFVLFVVWEVREIDGVEWSVVVKRGSQWDCERFVDKHPEGISKHHVRYLVEEQ